MTVAECVAWVRRYSQTTEIAAPDAYIEKFLKQAYDVLCSRLAIRLAGRMVSWLTVRYPAGRSEVDLTELEGFPEGAALLAHVARASSDGLASAEVLDPADERDFGWLTARNFRGDSYSSTRWRYADGILKLYPVPSTDVILRLAVVSAPPVFPDNDDDVFAFLGPTLSPLASRAISLFAARDLIAARGDDPSILGALVTETWQDLEAQARGQVARAEPIPGVAWRDDVA